MALPNSITVKRRLLFVLLFFTVIISLLIFRVGWLQIVQGSELQKKAYENQTMGSVINPQRGVIYDRNGSALAISASVETVTVNPNEIRLNANTEKGVKPEQIAETLAGILQMDKEDILKKITKKSIYEVVKRKIEKPVGDQIRKAIADKKLPGIRVIDDKKRFYPYSNFASHIVGFTGDDNQGLAGIEGKYDRYLKGAPGRVIFAKDASGRELAYSNEQYIAPQNGADIYLTIDEVIQHFAEKSLETAVINNKVKKGAAIVMDTKTGEILALAVKPDFNLNTPFEPINDELKAKWPTMEMKDRNFELQQMWRNSAISDTYEPGSTFKIITSAAGLEEGAVKTTDMFNDPGYRMILGKKIKCWRADNPHGVQTFVQGVQNSCNPVFMDVAMRLGADKFYNYMKGFGLFEKTGVDLPGEAINPPFHDVSKMTAVDLAVSSFGQSFQVTPIQMLSAINAVANEGKLVKPRIVKRIVADGQTVKAFEPEFVRQVISKETSVTLRNILESVVSVGTGKNAYIKGYRVAGKTGTSEKLPRGSGKYIASFGAFAPADDPRISVIVILDEPTGGVYYGGQIAAPVAGQIVDDTLRYLEVEPKYTPDELVQQKSIEVPDIRNMPLNQATKLLKERGLNYKVEGEGEAVVEQMPRAGFKITSNTPIYIYLNKNVKPSRKLVPDVTGKPISEASRILSGSGLNIKISGSGQAVSQSPAAGTEVDLGTVINVEFRNVDIGD